MQPIKRTRTPKSEVQADNVLPPSQEVPGNQYDSILKMIEDLQKENKELQKKVAQANNDISEEVKESKRKYGFEIDGVTRKKDELFEFGYKVLVHDRQEKVVVSSETIGRPVNILNSNTGKWTNLHNVSISFHDGTKTEIDVLDYINQSYVIKEKIPDEDIEVIDGEKFYTFRTEKFGTFTISQKYIN